MPRPARRIGTATRDAAKAMPSASASGVVTVREAVGIPRVASTASTSDSRLVKSRNSGGGVAWSRRAVSIDPASGWSTRVRATGLLLLAGAGQQVAGDGQVLAQHQLGELEPAGRERAGPGGRRVGVHAEVVGLADGPEHVEGVGDDHDAVAAAAGVAALQQPFRPGQVLVGGAAALLGEDGPRRHTPLDGPAGPRPALGEA